MHPDSSNFFGRTNFMCGLIWKWKTNSIKFENKFDLYSKSQTIGEGAACWTREASAFSLLFRANFDCWFYWPIFFTFIAGFVTSQISLGQLICSLCFCFYEMPGWKKKKIEINGLTFNDFGVMNEFPQNSHWCFGALCARLICCCNSRKVDFSLSQCAHLYATSPGPHWCVRSVRSFFNHLPHFPHWTWDEKIISILFFYFVPNVTKSNILLLFAAMA